MFVQSLFWERTVLSLLEKVQRLPVNVQTEIADRVVETVGNTARTSRIGDGKVFVLPLEGAMRVRTGEMGADAL